MTTEIVLRMSRFSDTLMEHFQSPINRGAMELPHLVGKGSLDGYSPFLTLYLRDDSDRIANGWVNPKTRPINQAPVQNHADFAK
jgi:hypothetical protein